MLLTEKEAREQSCPFFRYVVNERYVYRMNQAAIYAHENCKGPNCKIAWRWDPETAYVDETGNEYPPQKGYCGIVGRPIYNP